MLKAGDILLVPGHDFSGNVPHFNLAEKFFQYTGKTTIFYLAFPDDQHMPTRGLELFHDVDVPYAIFFKLCYPPLSPGRGGISIATALMMVPETSVNKNQCLVARENNVGRSRNIFSMKSKSISMAMKPLPY